MGDDRAVELRHEGRTYRAPSREVFFRWAREHRISTDDSYRVAGTDKWIPVSANSELSALLDPENWWKIKMGGKVYLAPDWETIVGWATEGRLSSDVQVEGPKTPPGGILGKASPELSPYLREWVYDDPEQQPVKLRFDGRTFIPGDLETLGDWIRESRVPQEAEVSIKGGEWQPVTECGHFHRDTWPVEDTLAGPSAGNGTPPERNGTEEPPETGKPEPSGQKEGPDGDRPASQPSGSGKDGLYRISTSYGEDYVFDDPGEVRELLRKRRIHNFDEVRHPTLPGGAMFVSEFIREFLPGGRSSVLLGMLAALFCAAGAAGIIFQQPHRQWMLIGGIAAMVIALVLLARIIWKR